MAEFLTVNDIPIEVDAEDAESEQEEVGGIRERAYGGQLITSRRYLKEVFRGRTTILPVDTAHAVRCLIMGLGHSFSYLGALPYSGKGLAPNAGYNASFLSTGGKYLGRLQLPATTGSITYATGVNQWAVWSIAFFRFESGAWHHYVVRSDGQKWYDGVLNGGLSTTFLTASATSFTLANTTGAAVDYSDIIYSPCLFPSTWPAVLAARTLQYPDTPKLRVGGEWFGAGSGTTLIDALGEVESMEHVQGVVGGAWTQRARRISFRLVEA